MISYLAFVTAPNFLGLADSVLTGRSELHENPKFDTDLLVDEERLTTGADSTSFVGC
jgi:hypothetical protein